MFRTVLAMLALVLALAACGEAEAETPSPYEGTWTVVDNSNGIDLVATIEGDHIEIDWLLEGDQSALYWKGSFPTAQGVVLESRADTDALDKSIMGSGDDRKTFRLEGDELHFELTALGHTQTIRLERTSS